MSAPIQTPSWAQVIMDAIEARLIDVHTAMPGIVDSYDPSTGLASVKPALKRVYLNGDTVDLPVIKRVPVLMPRASGGAAYVSMPLKQGDPVTMIFSERSLDVWKSTSGGSTVDPGDPRKHHLADAYCFPGGYPTLGATMASATASDVVVVNGSAVLTLKSDGTTVVAAGAGMTFELDPTGKFKATNTTGELVATIDKLMTDLKQLMTDIQGGLVTTMLGPEPLTMATFATDLAQFQTDLTAFETFKG
jgi:hypothetical protein